MSGFLWVALGGIIGSIARYATMLGIGKWIDNSFPYGTLTVNILGSFFMGLLIAYFSRLSGVSQEMRLFFAVGILGSFTTFSTFSLDVVTLIEHGELIQVGGYIVASIIFSVTALMLGIYAIRLL